jgi:lysozyme
VKKVASASQTIKGFDVSHFQPHLDFASQKASGMQFCFLKATEGVSYVDASFKSHWAHAKAAGLLRGAYHFFHPRFEPKAQAVHFVNTVGQLEADDLPCVIDWETTDHMPTPVDVRNGLEFIHEVKRLTGKDPIVYGGPYFLHALCLPEELKEYPLWVAHYGTSAPLVPEPWQVWSFWQYSDAGIDFNLFNGSLDQLKKLAGVSR